MLCTSRITDCCQQGSWLIEYPRPLAPNQVLLGPGTPRPARAIQVEEVRVSWQTVVFVGGPHCAVPAGMGDGALVSMLRIYV